MIKLPHYKGNWVWYVQEFISSCSSVLLPYVEADVFLAFYYKAYETEPNRDMSGVLTKMKEMLYETLSEVLAGNYLTLRYTSELNRQVKKSLKAVYRQNSTTFLFL